MKHAQAGKQTKKVAAASIPVPPVAPTKELSENAKKALNLVPAQESKNDTKKEEKAEPKQLAVKELKKGTLVLCVYRRHGGVVAGRFLAEVVRITENSVVADMFFKLGKDERMERNTLNLDPEKGWQDVSHNNAPFRMIQPEASDAELIQEFSAIRAKIGDGPLPTPAGINKDTPAAKVASSTNGKEAKRKGK